MRDERGLTASLERLDANRFDFDTMREVRARTQSLMDTLGFITRDDAFWEKLRDRAAVMEDQHILALRSFDDDTLAFLLTANGYRNPPPPRVDELIHDTRQALELAVGRATPGDIKAARARLSVFLYRTQRQLETADQGRAGETVPNLARRLAQVARHHAPAVVGVAAGATIEALLPSGLGVAAGFGISGKLADILDANADTAAHHVVENAVDWAVASTVAQPPNDADDEHDDLTGSHLSPNEVLNHHLVAALEDLRPKSALNRSVPRAAARASASAHLRRVMDLARDHEALPAVAAAANLAERAIASAGDSLDPDRDLAVALRALRVASDIAGDGRGDLISGTFEQATGDFFDDMFDSSRDRGMRELQALRGDWLQHVCPLHRAQLATQKDEGSASSGTSIGAIPDAQKSKEDKKGYFTM